MKITIIGHAPSVNGLYKMAKGGTHIYMTKEGQAYKEAVSELLGKLDVVLPPELRKKRLRVIYDFYFPYLWEATGIPVDVDVDNRIKIVQDAVAKALKFRDSWVWQVVATKHEGKERAVVTLEVFEG